MIMNPLSQRLVDEAVSAMLAAIEIYNKPNFTYRNETFAVLSINAWELLLKARWLGVHNGEIESLYITTRASNLSGKHPDTKRIVKTRSNSPRTHSAIYLVKKLTESNRIDRSASQNIQVMIEYRDCVVHFVNESPAFHSRLFEIGAACVKNFVAAVDDWFHQDLSQFGIPVMPLTFMNLPSDFDATLLNAEEKNFLEFLDNIDDDNTDPDSPYSVSINVEVRFTRSKSKDALPVQVSNDPTALSVRLTEENIREKYPWDYRVLSQRCRQRYNDFKENQKYHDIRKKLEHDERFAQVRYLDPGNPKSSKKCFYNSNILREFDKFYTK